jgi:hypothetical protein
MGTQGQATAANIGSGMVSNTNNTNNSNVNNLTAANSYLNTATGANNSATTAANNQFNQQQTGYQDQQQAQASQASSAGSMIGGIASAASMFMEKGGPVSKHAPNLSSGIPLPFLTQRPPGSFTAAAGPVDAPGQLPSYAEGGPISKQGALPHPIIPGTTDNKLIAATPGEFMLPKDVAEFMGHEKLHNLIDKTREKMAQRQGIPTARPTSAHYAR